MPSESQQAQSNSPNTSDATSGGVDLAIKRNSRYAAYKVIRRNGEVVPFDERKVGDAMKKAFIAVEGAGSDKSQHVNETVHRLAIIVANAVTRRPGVGNTIHIEDIQDQVELSLMREGAQKVARAYVLYREERRKERAAEQAGVTTTLETSYHVTRADGTKQPLDIAELSTRVISACQGLSGVSAQEVVDATIKNIFDGISERDLGSASVMCARQMVEKEPNYTYVAARLLQHNLRAEALTLLAGKPVSASQEEMKSVYPRYFKDYIAHGIKADRIDKRLAEYDLDRIGKALSAERDLKFTYLSLQTLYDRYFLHTDEERFELPQAMFMRVAMGLALNEIDREARAIEFYNLLSNFDFMSSTPTLFNSGTPRPQLSSCFLTSVPDDLHGIFSSVHDNAMLAKYSGGIGNDWTRVRGMGAHIKGTNGKSQGVVPFMKVANDTAVAVNQGGKRKGAVCAYLETWHIDVEEFLDLRKNTGDDRRRTHDMNTANWIPDLFMKRVHEGADWTLFSPEEAPDLHDKCGKAFEVAYIEAEERAERGEIRVFKKIGAISLWRKMLSMLFETGHPWVTFKDSCNLRSPQQHCGVVHSSNLCTEITLNTNDDEVAVCNLGSINLPNHMKLGPTGIWELDLEKLKATTSTAMRMLDNVIDINFYTIPQARNSNLQHRPVGLGIMGFQDALFLQGIPYASEDALEFADQSMDAISYYAIWGSTELAQERGRYKTFEGSLWSRGILPKDSLDILKNNRGEYFAVDESQTMEWDKLRERVKTIGMRNSNCLAIAPTATISNICGVSQSIEPIYQNLYVKSNMSGEFTVINHHLADALKSRDLWDEVMVHDLKYYDGSLAEIDRVPDDLKEIYSTAWEVDPSWLVMAASRRQKWIDQAQSLNLYMANPSGKKLDELYRLAWIVGLKTTYYLRSMGATHAEKSTFSTTNLNAVGGTYNANKAPTACSLDDPDCEACQ